MRIFSLFFLFYLAAPCQAATKLIDQIQVDDVAVDKNPEQMSGYTQPNENHTYLFEPSLRNRKGAYVGVGTFRTFAAMMLADFSQIVQVDINPVITFFNRRNNELIATSADRREYLSRLTGHQFTQGEMKAMDLGIGLASIERSIPWEARNYSEWLKGKPLTNAHTILGHRARMLKKQWTLNVFGSDKAFNKARDMILAGKVTVIECDLVHGKSALRTLGKALREQNERVSVLDLSNVLDYVNKSELAALGDNLDHLPYTSDALIVGTDDFRHDGPPMTNDFSYHTRDLSESLAILKGSDPDKFDRLAQVSTRLHSMYGNICSLLKDSWNEFASKF